MSTPGSICARIVVGAGDAAPQPPKSAPDAFPNRAIKIVVPFPAGGPSDVLARMIGQKMSEDWGQPVVIENRPGANTVLGAQQVAKAAPDGYTLLMAIDSTLTMNQYLYRTPPYDPFNDFAPITLTAKTMQLLIVNAASDVKTVKDLIAKAKAQPGKLNYGAGTITTKLTGYLFNKAAGIETVLVPYNGSAEVAQGLLTKSVDFSFDGPSASLSLIQGGQFRVLAKFDPRPFPPVPDLPLITTEVPNIDEITVWLGLVAPKGTPAADHRQAARAKSRRSWPIPPSRRRRMPRGCSRPPARRRNSLPSSARKRSAGRPVVKETGMKYD